MGFSHKSDRKSDKETQSPMLRVFKEIIQNEHKDTEKANLLKEKQEKQKKYNRTRSKSDQKADSSSVDRSKQKHKKKMAERVQDQSNWVYDENGTQSMFQPYQSEKRDSWWLWKDADKKRTDDSCSCATCPLKKLMGTDYACVGCLIILFLVSVLITSTVVFKTMPLNLGHRTDEDSLDLKRQMVTEETVETTPRDMWNSDLTNRFGSYVGLFGSGYGDSSFRDSSFKSRRHRLVAWVSPENVSSDIDKTEELSSSPKFKTFRYEEIISAHI